MDERQDSKIRALRKHGSLNTRADRVHDTLFQDNEFFDPYDVVQVKYEMLRRVRVDDCSVTAAADAFGFSRVAFYRAMACFREQGLPGLLPHRRGPKEAHKLTEEVLERIDRLRAADHTLRAPQLAAMVLEDSGLSVHPRSIERAFARRAKRGRRIESP